MVLGEMEQLDWVSDIKDGAYWVGEACEVSLAGGDGMGRSKYWIGGS